MSSDPRKFWYKGELGFFDNCIIPLARKLKDCGVFGVSSDECLNYALQNRAEWEARGETIVVELIKEIQNGDAANELNKRKTVKGAVSTLNILDSKKAVHLSFLPDSTCPLRLPQTKI